MARLLHVVFEGLGSFAAYPRAAWLELYVLGPRDFAAASKPMGKASRYEAWFFNTIFAKRHAMGRFIVPSSSLRAYDVAHVAAEKHRRESADLGPTKCEPGGRPTVRRRPQASSWTSTVDELFDALSPAGGWMSDDKGEI